MDINVLTCTNQLKMRFFGRHVRFMCRFNPRCYSTVTVIGHRNERLVGRIEFIHKVGPLKMVVSQYMFIEDLFMNKVESEPVNQQTRASKTLS